MTVEQLNKQQNSGLVHPYTCNRLPSECEIHIIPRDYSKDGVLIATEDGWICPCGKYRQEFRGEQNNKPFPFESFNTK